MKNKKIKSTNKVLKIIIFILFSISFFASFSHLTYSSDDCIDFYDCNKSNCIGSISICDNGQCKYSECLFEKTQIEDKKKSDNDYITYSNDIVDRINISQSDINTEAGFFESVIEWAMFNKAILFLVSIFAAGFLVVIVILLWQMIKTNPIILVIAVMLMVLIGGFITLMLIKNPDMIEKMAVGDFSSFDEKYVNELTLLEKNRQTDIISQKTFSREFNKAIDSNINYAHETKIKSEKGISSITVLEFKDEDSALKYIDNKIKATSNTKKLLGMIAYIYETNDDNIKTYRITKDNKIFFFTGIDEDIDNDIEYMFKEEKIEKKIEIEFENSFCQNINQINFKLIDHYEEIAQNNYDILIEGINGFNMNESCKKYSYYYSCDFNGELKIGSNIMAINVIKTLSSKINSEYEEKTSREIITKKSYEIIYDPINPQVKFELLDKNKLLKTIISDTGTGIDLDKINISFNNVTLENLRCQKDGLKIQCNYDLNPKENENTIIVTIEDKCNNKIEEIKTFIEDNTPPDIKIISRVEKIVEIFDKSGIKNIKVEGVFFEPNNCLIINDVYTCTFENRNKTIEIEVEDFNYNKVKKII